MDVPDLPANGVTQVQIIGDSVGPARHALCGTQRLKRRLRSPARRVTTMWRALVNAQTGGTRAPSRPKADPLASSTSYGLAAPSRTAPPPARHRPGVSAGRRWLAVTNMPNNNATVWPASVKPPPMVAVAKPSDTRNQSMPAATARDLPRSAPRAPRGPCHPTSL